MDQIARVPHVAGLYISENLTRASFQGAGITDVVTVGDSSDLPYKQWPGRVDFRFPDAELTNAAWGTMIAAVQHCIGRLIANRLVAVHCAAGVNRSSLVSVLVCKR